jgi:hypothetical protein
MQRRIKLLAAASILSTFYLWCPPAHAEDTIETAGVAVGVTAGNMWFLPSKAISMSIGALSGALSYVLTGGNAELTKQIWQDTSEGPYLITPSLARTSIGERPELLESNKNGMQP